MNSNLILKLLIVFLFSGCSQNQTYSDNECREIYTNTILLNLVANGNDLSKSNIDNSFNAFLVCVKTGKLNGINKKSFKSMEEMNLNDFGRLVTERQ